MPLERNVPTWADEHAPAAKFDRNEIEIPRYAQIERDFSSAARQLVRQFQRGEIGERELVRRFQGHLLDAETEAFVAGRRARRDLRPDLSMEEELMLHGRHSRNMKFFRGFVRDMAAGSGKMDYEARADLYAKSLWSLYTRGETSDFVDPEDVNARYFWITDPGAEHCQDCRQRAKWSRTGDPERGYDGNGFTWEQLVALGFPGESTICMTRCRCHIETKRLKVVVPERFDDAKAARSPAAGIKELEELLGGESLPLRIPVAGLPSAKLEPYIVERSLRAEPKSDDLARRLPLLPLALTKPSYVLDLSPDRKLYSGFGLDVVVERQHGSGLWHLLMLALSQIQEKRKSA